MKKFILGFVFFSMQCLFSHSQTWNDVGGGVYNFGGATVEAMCAYQGELYVGGSFMEAGNLPISGIARWNGTKWDSISHGDTALFAQYFTTYNNELYMAGSFVTPWPYLGQDFLLATWDGQKLSKVNGTGNDSASGTIYAMAVYKGELYIAGAGFIMGGITENRIIRWDGNSWKTVGGGVGGGPGPPSIHAMAVYNNELYVGGVFGYAGGLPASSIARWDGAEWDSVGSGVINGSITTLIVDSVNNILYAGGGFYIAGGIVVNGVAKWDGTKWDSVGYPIAGAWGMSMYRGKLYVGGSSNNASFWDTIIAYRDSTQWNLVIGPNNGVTSMYVFNDELYVGGYFDKVYDPNDWPPYIQTVNYIARYYVPPPDTSTGIGEVKSEKYKLNVYPNPTKESFTVKINIGSGKGAIKIYDIKGAMLSYHKIKQGKTSIEIKTSDWSKGIYLCTLEVEGKAVKSEKMVVE